MAAISTYQTYLMYKNNGTWENLTPIKSFPDMGGEPERIDVTTLSDAMRQYVPGVQDIASTSFSANYSATEYAKINALAGTQHDYALWFGATGAIGSEVPDGHNGKFTWKGDIMCYVSGGDVNAAVEMTIVCFPSTVFVFNSGATGATGGT